MPARLRVTAGSSKPPGKRAARLTGTRTTRDSARGSAHGDEIVPPSLTFATAQLPPKMCSQARTSAVLVVMEVHGLWVAQELWPVREPCVVLVARQAIATLPVTRQSLRSRLRNREPSPICRTINLKQQMRAHSFFRSRYSSLEGKRKESAIQQTVANSTLRTIAKRAIIRSGTERITDKNSKSKVNLPYTNNKFQTSFYHQGVLGFWGFGVKTCFF